MNSSKLRKLKRLQQINEPLGLGGGIEVRFINQSTRSTSRGPDPLGFARLLKKMTEVEEKNLLSTDPHFFRGIRIRASIAMSSSNIIKYLPTLSTRTLMPINTSVNELHASLDAFAVAKTNLVARGIFTSMRVGVPIVHLPGAASGALCELATSLIDVYHNQPIIRRFLGYVIQLQSDYIRRCIETDCLSSIMDLQPGSRKYKPNIDVNDLNDALLYHSKEMLRRKEVEDTLKNMKNTIETVRTFKFLLEDHFQYTNMDSESILALISSTRFLQAPAPLDNLEMFYRRNCMSAQKSPSCRNLITFYTTMTSLLDIVSFKLQTVLRLSRFHHLVSITQNNVANQRIASTSRFMTEVFGNRDSYCEMECRGRGLVTSSGVSRDEHVMYTWMVEYVDHVIGSRDTKLCQHHCGK